jgi:hypothetical protein
MKMEFLDVFQFLKHYKISVFILFFHLQCNIGRAELKIDFPFSCRGIKLVAEIGTSPSNISIGHK